MKEGGEEKEKGRQSSTVALIKGNTCYADLITRRTVGRQKEGRRGKEEGEEQGQSRGNCQAGEGRGRKAAGHLAIVLKFWLVAALSLCTPDTFSSSLG